MSTLDVAAIRKHFIFPATGRVVTNNASTTQPPLELVELFQALAPSYENVHRGQSQASRATTTLFEEAYDTIARFIDAPSRRNLAIYRSTTEALNAVMYSLMTELRDGDNIVTTMLEHNSNYVPWHGLCREILPRFGVRVELRLARFDPETGELDVAHLASLVDARTKLVACTGASNFFGSKTPLAVVRTIARDGGYRHPDGGRGARILVDAAQLVPSTAVRVGDLDVDYLAFSFHKLLAPFGVGVLYAREALLANSRPFLYGGDMVADGQVTAEGVEYNRLPWRHAAGTPNILGTIVSAQAIRLLVDLALWPNRRYHFGSSVPIARPDLLEAMRRIAMHTRRLTERALERLSEVPGLRIYGPRSAARRTPLVAFNIDGRDPFAVAESLSSVGVEARAGCHCATLAHRALGLDPPASCRLSFYVYNTLEDVDCAAAAVAEIARARAA